MSRSATDVMQDILFAAVVDSLDALKSASKGVPNTLLRDINAIHTNSTFADLPKELQSTIIASVRGAFNRLLKEGYSVAPGNAPPPRAAPANRVPSGERRPPSAGPRPPAGERRPPRPGQRPNRNPRPPRPK
jgi:hypothetical protein